VADQNNNNQNTFLGSGWSFPVTFSAGNSQLNVTANEQNVNECIAIILQTRVGERIMEPQFGSGLQQFFFKKIDEALKSDIIETVERSLLQNEPRITVKEVSVDIVDVYRGLAEIAIVYIYNQTNTRHNYVYPFNIIEGTNLN
jgi:phage baseplate assembly protein W